MFDVIQSLFCNSILFHLILITNCVMTLAENSKVRMNLAAIKKVDPYAKDIVDTSSHVAFYTFNSEQNEWEKTDVEGAFFIYSRNAQPFHSIFINNRINTTSFVEPITNQLELQSQPPFLLYRNERSRIRGFWFYNSEECDRIGNQVGNLVREIDTHEIVADYEKPQLKQEDINIFKMLSKAQQEYNSQQKFASCNVLRFFAAAKPRTTEIPFFQHTLVNTLSVQQVESQQRAKTPRAALKAYEPNSLPYSFRSHDTENCPKVITSAPMTYCTDLDATKLEKLCSAANIDSSSPHITSSIKNECLQLKEASTSTKPTLMPPTMFDKPVDIAAAPISTDPLDESQLVQAFNYLIHNDRVFVQKLHEAYLKVYKSADYYQ